MTTLPLPRRDRQLAALGLTVLVHALLVLGWQAARRLPFPQTEPVWLPVRIIAQQVPRQIPQQERPTPQPAARVERQAASRAATALPFVPDPTPDTAAEPLPAAPAEPVATAPPDLSAQAILERARRDAGGVDRALRKEARPLIVAPYDSPRIRLRKGIEAAAEMAPNKWYEAPKIAELVNNTGNGERRTRVITGDGTYCVTESATNARIDMIEKHGKIRKTNCSKNEGWASAQEWRTARDP